MKTLYETARDSLIVIESIASGSTTTNSLHHLARLAREGLTAIESADRAQQDEPVAMHHDPALVEAYNKGYEACLATKAAAPADAPTRTKMWDNTNDEGQVGWYFDCDGHYIDVERDENGKYSVYFRNRADQSEAWLDQAAAAPVPDTGIPTAGEGEQELFLSVMRHRILDLKGVYGRSSFAKQTDLAHYNEGFEDARNLAAEIVAEFASRCRAQGGMTKDNDNFRAPVSSTPTSGAVAEIARNVMERERAVTKAGFALTADLLRIDGPTVKGVDYVPRDALCSRIVAWRVEMDKAPKISSQDVRSIYAAAPHPSEARAGEDV